MVIKNGLFSDIMRENRKENIYLYGAGKRLQEMLHKYGEKLAFTAVVDNDLKLQQVGKVRVGTREFPVISIEELEKRINDKTCIILTMHRFTDVYTDMENREKLNHASCYIYDFILLAEKDEKLYPRGYRLPKEAFLIEKKSRIPKVIHYCWFGGNEMPKEFVQYMESWKRYCPDYEIIRWDESNYDVTKNSYMYAAYKDKKWAYVSDYARVDIVNRYGGIYMDTDVELVKSLDILLREKAFCGYEDEKYVNLGLGFGSIKNNLVLQTILQCYESLTWDGGKTACPIYQTRVLKQYGLAADNSFQRLENITVFPTVCFCGKSIHTRRIKKMEDTFAIHHFAATWCERSEEDRLRERADYGD